LFILRPATPYVCLGFHQDAEQEIEMQFAKENNIPVFRREVGGGAVYLDGEQLFYQMIIRKDNPNVPHKIAHFYEKFLAPVVDTYREFGVDAQYKPINDIIVNSRKISGNGAAEINDMMILVGNFIMDFDYEMMSKILRVPDEKFRDKVYKTLNENLTTIERETGDLPMTQALGDSLIRRYQDLLGNLEPAELDNELVSKADELFDKMYTPEWLYYNDRRRKDAKEVKISEGVYVIQKMVKTSGGLVRVTATAKDDILRDVHLSGDFFFYPAPKLADLEAALEGVQYDAGTIEQTIEQFYEQFAIQSPGVTPEDLAEVLTA